MNCAQTCPKGLNPAKAIVHIKDDDGRAALVNAGALNETIQAVSVAAPNLRWNRPARRATIRARADARPRQARRPRAPRFIRRWRRRDATAKEAQWRSCKIAVKDDPCPRAPWHADRPQGRGHAGHLGRARRIAGGCLRALRKNQELPLAHERPAFPRLPSAPRRARRTDFRHDRSDSPSGRARSAARPCARSATSPGASAFSTTTPTMSIRKTCWRSCVTITRA